MSIWSVLSQIDCNEHIEKKGKFSYLAWTWAWAMVKEHYPESTYDLLTDTVYPDGTMEVRVTVCVKDGEKELIHTMWLPVLDYKNNPIASPNAFDINTARMRCLVKCLAMFGLGHYIYAGESTPQEPVITAEQLETMTELLANGSDAEFTVRLKSMADAAKDAFFNSAPNGEKTKFKQAARDKEGSAMAAAKNSVLYIQNGINNGSADEVSEATAELDKFEKALVWNALTDIEKRQIEDLLK